MTATATRIVREGDLSLAIDTSAQDEVGELARSIQTLMTRLGSVPQHAARCGDGPDGGRGAAERGEPRAAQLPDQPVRAA
nr:HAMP domain-containing protein [Corallococcus exiguus]